MAGFRVEQIDHVHVHVADREAAARWYCRVLGLRPDAALAAWAADPKGPLMLADAAGRTRLALFSDPTAARAPGRTVAFRITAAGFAAFLAALPRLGLRGAEGRALSAADVVDHGLARSIYFTDPDGNRIELTTYERPAAP